MDIVWLVLAWISRFAHVFTAIILVGGVAFIRIVLQPAAHQALSENEHAQLRQRIMATWKKIVHAGIGLMLVSGGYNYFLAIRRLQEAGVRDPLYHALMGTKILIALAIFFIASALVGRSAAFEGMRQNTRKWLLINLLLAIAVVGISNFLKLRGLPVQPAKAAMHLLMPSSVG